MPPKKRVQPDIDPNSSFTPDSFEKELKALARKAQDETWSKTLQEQASAFVKPLVLLSLIAIFSNVSELTLSPVYGSIPASIWHSKLVMTACFVGWSSNLLLSRYLPVKPLHLLPVIAIYIPVAQFYLFKLSNTLTAQWGPLVTEALTLFPVIVLSVACTATSLEGADFSRLPKWLGDSIPGLGSWCFYMFMENYTGQVIQSSIGKNFLQTRIGLELILGACYALVAPSKLLAFAIPALIHTAALNPHVSSPYALQALNTSLATDGWSILDRRESLTGYISVLESQTQGFRVMRCDHSLLGGEWIKYTHGQVAEPVYGVFVMLEAVRLVRVPEPVEDSKAKALIIGLGIGTTPAALVAHGIDTTVVEIDPVVNEFASKYFRMPAGHTTVIEDAVVYTDRLANETSGQRFDYIVHDVFTGGAEPVPLFTLEFFRNLYALLTPNGVIAINYAGDFTLPPPAMIVRTIREVFPSCRIFRETARDEEAIERDGRDFTNMVIFCTKHDEGKLDFRDAVEADMLGTQSRRVFLMPQNEVLDSDFVAMDSAAIVRRNDTAELVRFHERSAMGHWSVMRVVLPAKVWESW